MRAFTLVTAFTPVVLVQAFNPQLCGGVGGCPVSADPFLPYRPMRCPDGTRATIGGRNLIHAAFESGTYQIITNEEFPTTCRNGVRPGVNDTLFVSETLPGLRAYGFINGRCGDRTIPITIADCYASNVNPHVFTVCDVQDLSGGSCEPFMDAGRCESFGVGTDPACATYTPDQVEEPCFNDTLGTRCG